jgi:hypothetical protein
MRELNDKAFKRSLKLCDDAELCLAPILRAVSCGKGLQLCV